MTELLENTHSKEFNDAVGLAYGGEAAREHSEALKGDLKKKAISDIGRDALRQKQVAEEALSDKRFAKAVDIFNDEELGEDNETETSLEKWTADTIAALVEEYSGYEVDGHKITEADFGLIETKDKDGDGNETGEVTHTVMLTSKSGIDLSNSDDEFHPARSYNSIETSQVGHEIGDDGEVIDFPARAVYEAFINGEIALHADPLPDSNVLKPWTYTWLKEKAGRVDALVGGVCDGRLYVFQRHRVDDRRNCRFRPAVVRKK